MSGYSKFTKDGLKYFKWNSESKEYEIKERETNLPSLKEECQIDSGVTLGDIFDAVDKDELLKFFISNYSWCQNIDEFHKEAKQPIPPGEENNHLHFLEIYWDAEVGHYKDGTNIDVSYWFHARGDCEDPNFKENMESMWYSVSCAPTNHLVHLPVVLNKKIEITETSFHPYSTKVLGGGEKEFTLLEVLDAIYDDISFYGGPREKEEFIQEMRNSVEEFKQEMNLKENKNGEE